MGWLKGKILRLLAETSTRKALISLVSGLFGWKLSGGQIEAIASWVGATYVVCSVFMEDKPKEPAPAPAPAKARPAPVVVEEQSVPDALGDGDVKIKNWDGKVPGQFP